MEVKWGSFEFRINQKALWTVLTAIIIVTAITTGNDIVLRILDRFLS